jgi:peptide/nickel transport system substrate-binding protein
MPSLANSWSISNGGLTYTFQLRQGVLFHDGTPFNSSSIQPSFQRRTAVNGGPAYMVAGVASVQTPSPYTAVINLTAPNTAFLDYLASSYGPMMESPTALAAHAGTDNDQTYLQTHDIGTGPFTLTQAKVGVSYQMKAFPQYWGKKPYYTTVNLPVIDNLSTQEIQFNSGQLAGILHDLTAPAVAQYRSSSAATFYSLPVLEEEGVYVNEHTGFLTSQTNRQALLQAINSKAIVAGVFPNRATVPTQASPSGLLPAGFGKQGISYNPGAFGAVVRGLPSAQKQLTVGYDSGAPDDQLVAEQIAAELQALGLTTKVVGYQTSEIYGWVGSAQLAATKGPDILVYYVWPDAYNAYTWNHITYDSTGGLQYLTCSVPGIDATDTQAVTTGSNALYNSAVQAAVRQGCWLNVANRNDAMVLQPWMKGVNQAHVVAMPWALLLNQLYPG